MNKDEQPRHKSKTSDTPASPMPTPPGNAALKLCGARRVERPAPRARERGEGLDAAVVRGDVCLEELAPGRLSGNVVASKRDRWSASEDRGEWRRANWGRLTSFVPLDAEVGEAVEQLERAVCIIGRGVDIRYISYG